MRTTKKFTQIEIGMLPEEWKDVKLADAIDINPKRDLKKGTSAKKISMDCLNPFKKKIRGWEKSIFSGGSKFTNKDTLMARITPCLENGKTAYVDILDDGEVGFGSTEFIVLSGKTGKTINEFVYYLSISPQLRKEAIQSMTGTSGRQRVQNDSFGEIKISLPPLTEQSAIAKILSDLDSKIELNQEMNKTLEAFSRAIFKRWFIDFEFPSEKGKPYKSSGGELVDSELGKIPKGWRAGHLFDIANNVRDIISHDELGADTSYIALEHIPQKSIAIDNWGTAEDLQSNKFKFAKGDILFGKLRPYFHKVGIAPVAGVCSTDVLVINSEMPEAFAYVLLIVSDSQFIEYVTAGSTGTKMPRTDWQHMSKYEIRTPSLHVLKSFNEFTKPLFEKMNINICEIRNLKTIRDSLLPKLMSGKIRVPIEV